MDELLRMIIPIKLDFVKKLTDDLGILQHSKFAMPNKKEGYTTDDNARALIACTTYYRFFRDDIEIKKLIDTYLSFLLYMQKPEGNMHNFLSYNRQFMDEIGSEDCMGRALWGCAYCLDSELPEGTRSLAKEIFDKLFVWSNDFSSPRAKAFSLIGLFHYLKACPKDQNVTANIRNIANQLSHQFELESSEGWEWFESYLTYSNARLPHSLFLAYEATGDNLYLQIAVKSMKFLVSTLDMNGTFVPIGNRGWYRKGLDRAIYDQQSIEASCMIDAATAAFRNTKDETYVKAAYSAFDWFFGKNLQGKVVYDLESGGCCDGLTPFGLNLNKGAESTIAYLQARLTIDRIKYS
jgi:hypothetical protein